jgi:hypothetical protein
MEEIEHGGAASVEAAMEDGFGGKTTIDASTGRDAAGVAEQDGAGRAGESSAHIFLPLNEMIEYPDLQTPSTGMSYALFQQTPFR